MTEDPSLFDATFFNFSADVAAVSVLASDFYWRRSRTECFRAWILKSDCSSNPYMKLWRTVLITLCLEIVACANMI